MGTKKNRKQSQSLAKFNRHAVELEAKAHVLTHGSAYHPGEQMPAGAHVSYSGYRGLERVDFSVARTTWAAFDITESTPEEKAATGCEYRFVEVDPAEAEREEQAYFESSDEREYVKQKKANAKAGLPRRRGGRSMGSLYYELIDTWLAMFDADVAYGWIAKSIIYSIESTGPRYLRTYGHSPFRSLLFAVMTLFEADGTRDQFRGAARVYSFEDREDEKQIAYSFLRFYEAKTRPAARRALETLATWACNILVDSARKAGRPEAWLLERVLEVNARAQFTDAKQANADRVNVSKLMGAWMGRTSRSDEIFEAASPQLKRALAANLKIMPTSSRSVKTAKFLGGDIVRSAARHAYLLRYYGYKIEAETIIYRRGASERSLRRVVDEAIALNAKWHRINEAPVSDDHPALKEARRSGFTIVRDESIKAGNYGELDGDVIRIHPQLSQRAAYGWLLDEVHREKARRERVAANLATATAATTNSEPAFAKAA